MADETIEGGELAGKVAMVTGAASGIGRAVALLFVNEGATIGIGDLDTAGLAETERLLGDAAVLSRRLDVTDDGDVERFVAELVGKAGRLDCAVNAAGLAVRDTRPTAMADVQDFQRVMHVNVTGVFLCMRHQLQAMLAAGNGGAIVNVASGAAYVAVPGNAAYVASKHAVMGLTKCAAADHAAEGIRVNALCPGFTRTPMAMTSLAVMGVAESDAAASAPANRIAEPSEQAEAALFLCSGKAAFMVGHGLVVDGGHSIV